MRLKHYSLRTERCYCDWVERFIRFHRTRRPRAMREREVRLSPFPKPEVRSGGHLSEQ
jgi:hypothetical protein